MTFSSILLQYNANNRLPISKGFFLAKPHHWRSHLILLFKSIAVRGLHQVNMLQEISHPDGRVQLPSLVGGFCAFAEITRDIQESAGLCCCTVIFICIHKKSMHYVPTEQ